jgi:serine/threonine-protein kinase
MITCQTCHSQVPASSQFCASCGNPVSAAAADATVLMPAADSAAAAAAAPARVASTPGGYLASGVTPRPGASFAPRMGRFGPGAILAGRYQIIGLLGKGGMGEVYRANDLTLDQDVALKFLPESMTGNPAMLSRFHGEVRIARQVSHANVCRVYDIGEADGQLFLSMEYVDGEDLGSLLRRIGRLPSDKGVEFARKICAGLAAAHDKGVLHRDLKPANIMIDSQGRVVIMDFGLAAVNDQVQGMEIRAGTPAYMSPEQLAGREVTPRSDVYALGLVLHELFTGRRPFEADTLAELVAKQQHVDQISMTTVVRDLDPSVESAIARCLAPDPKRRPGSALAVSAALPGGDPLAAALAAGDTPSPEMVAASGKTSGLRPAWAVAVCGSIAALMIALLVLAPGTCLLTRMQFELPPDALTFKAQEAIRAFGYTQKPVDTAHGFIFDQDYLRYVQTKENHPNRWERVSNPQPAALVFWYRQSPQYLEPKLDRGPVTYSDPPQSVTGMANVQLDAKGRLAAFTAVPPQLDESNIAAAAPADWTPAFTAAGLDISKLKETAPKWTPLAAVDERKAWEGVWPEAPDQPLRVEAAAWRGRIVYFDLLGPWSRPFREQRLQMTRPERVMRFLLPFFAVASLAGVAMLARFNIRRGRGDMKGAVRVGAAGFIISLAGCIFGTDYFPTAVQVARLFAALAYSLLIGGVLWLGYMALEPYVRRHWPGAIVSWTRLLAGGLRDPLLGRDILAGVAIGLFFAVAIAVGNHLDFERSGPSTQIMLPSLLGARHTIASALNMIPGALVQMFVMFFLLFIMRVLLRKEWIAAIGFVGLFTLLNAASSLSPVLEGALGFIMASGMYIALTRFGLVTFVVAIYTNTLLVLLPVTADFSEWYSPAAAFALGLILLLAAYGAHTAIAGRSLIEDDLL